MEDEGLGAGWYPDPSGRNQQRWWDGVRWSDTAGGVHQQFSDPVEGLPPPDGADGPSRSAMHAVGVKALFGRVSTRKPASETSGEAVSLWRACEYISSEGTAYRGRVTITDQTIFFDQLLPKGRGYSALFAFPAGSVVGAAVKEWNEARSEYGWKVTTGFLHGPTQVAATSALVMRLTDEQTVTFRLIGAPPQVEAVFAPVFPSLGEGVPADADDRYDQLRKAAALRDDGILNEDEFEREKRRILGT